MRDGRFERGRRTEERDLGEIVQAARDGGLERIHLADDTGRLFRQNQRKRHAKSNTS